MIEYITHYNFFAPASYLISNFSTITTETEDFVRSTTAAARLISGRDLSPKWLVFTIKMSTKYYLRNDLGPAARIDKGISTAIGRC